MVVLWDALLSGEAAKVRLKRKRTSGKARSFSALAHLYYFARQTEKNPHATSASLGGVTSMSI